VRRGSWAVGALAALVFANSLANDFAFDDLHIIEQNEGIHSLETLPGTLAEPYWPGELGRALAAWRPLSTGLYGLEWALWGDRPMAFHAVNVGLHVAASVLTFWLLLTLLPFVGALAGALVFAVHPVHVEAVANVVGRAEVLSALFYLAACLLFVRWRERIGLARTAALCALYAAAFATKESAVTLPGAIFLLDGFFTDRSWREAVSYVRERWQVYAGLAATAGLMLMGRKVVLGGVGNGLAPFGADVLEQIPRIWTVAGLWPHYFRLLVFPYDLSVDYAPAVVRILYGWNGTNVLGSVLVLAVLVLALWSWRAPPQTPGQPPPRAMGFGIVWFVITVSVVANVAFLSGILLAERTFYLPSVGFVACIGWFVSSLHSNRPRLTAILVTSVIVLMGARTVTRNAVWKDNLTVFNSLLADHPESGRAQWAWGDVLFNRGQVSEAMRAWRLAIGIAGAHYSLTTKIGRTLVDAGRPESARPILEMAWRDKPQYALAPSLLASTYVALEAWPEAESAALATLEIDPGHPYVLHLLAAALAAQGKWEEAVTARRATIDAGEGAHWQQWYWLAEEEAQAGHGEEAQAALDSARARAVGPEVELQLDSLERALGLR
jgi:Flp pilus assembly protein TadD